MKISTKTRYGTRALLDLALNQVGNSPLSLRDLAERQSISLNYLEHIVTPLVNAGIVHSTRGSKGGLLLSKSAIQINMKEVVDLLEGSATLGNYAPSSICNSQATFCATENLWSEVSRAIGEILKSTTLQDLVEKQRSQSNMTNMFHI